MNKTLNIKKCFEFYESIKKQENKLKAFTFLDRQLSIVKYLKKNKKSIIENINYAFLKAMSLIF